MSISKIITVQSGESIQGAIDRAPEGGIICLEEGRWKGQHLTIRKSLTLCGAGADKTAVRAGDLEEEQALLHIAAPEGEEIRVHLKDLSLGGASQRGYCLVAEGAVRLTLERCAVAESEGQGIYLSFGPRVLIQDCIIRKNGTGIWLLSDSQVTIRHSTFAENDEGLDVWNDCQAVIENSVFCQNREAIEVSAKQVVIEDCLFSRNESAVSGSAEQITIRDCIVEDGEWGIDLSVPPTQALIERCRVQRNEVSGISINCGAQATIRKCVVSDNRYGIEVEQSWGFCSRAVIERCVIAKNEIGIWVTEFCQATIRGCPIHENKKGLYLDCSGVEATIERNRFWRNGRNIEYFRNQTSAGGYIAGGGNEFEDNSKRDLPVELSFLLTRAGGKLSF